MKRILLFIIVSLSLMQTNLFAQDPHYSQYNEMSVYINPAMCAVGYDVRAVLNYRSQWQNVSVPYKTYGATAEFAIAHKKTRKAYLTTGLMAYQDVAGSGNMTDLHLGGILGVVVNTGKNSKLSFAGTFAVDQRRISTGNFQWENQFNGYQYDASIPAQGVSTTNQITYADFGAGINYHYSKSERYISSNDGSRFDIGFSMYHLNTPLVGFYGEGDPQYIRYNQHASFTIAMPHVNANIIPSYILMFQGPSVEINAGIMFRYIISEASKRSTNIKPMAFSAGAYYRSKDAFIPQILYEYDKYAIGASYDFNTSALTPVSGLRGGLEIVLRYNWNPAYGRSTGVSTAPRSTPYFK